MENLDASNDGEPLADEAAPALEGTLFRPLTIGILLFDFVTGIIGLVSLTTGEDDVCCGAEIERPPAFLWITVAQLGLTVMEIYPVVFKYIMWLTIFNPWLGFLITAGLLYQSNNNEAIATLSLELVSLCMQWYTVRFIEGKRLCCTLHILSVIPACFGVFLLSSYLIQDGECVDNAPSDGGASISIRRGNGEGLCILCETNGLPWNASCPANVGTTQGQMYGTYCGNLTAGEPQYCWFPN